MAAKYPLIDDVDFFAMGRSDCKKTKGGIPMVYSRKSESDRSPVVFQLNKPDPVVMDETTPAIKRDEALAKLPYVRTNFHLLPEPKFEVKDGKFTIFFGLPEETIPKIRNLDESNIAAITANCAEWFKRGNLSPEIIRANYTPLVTRYPQSSEVDERQKTTCLRVKVDPETEILVQNSESYRKFYRGDMHDILPNTRVVLVLKDNGMYFRSSESGGQLMAKRILVLHGNSDASKMEFNLDMDIEVEENFEPPAPAAAAADATVHEYAASEQTVVNGGISYTGPAVVF